MSMQSMYERERAAREQGYYFAAERILSRWESFGHQKHATVEQAYAEGQRAVADGQCESFIVRKVTL
jgi:hypothetical protein